jgi:hypothetical protein
MQSNAERWELAGTLYRIVRCGTTDHEARGGENSIAMGAFNGLVNWDGESVVIGRHDKPLRFAEVGVRMRGFHCAPRGSLKLKVFLPNGERRLRSIAETLQKACAAIGKLICELSS